jgi:hypothetical protein
MADVSRLGRNKFWRSPLVDARISQFDPLSPACSLVLLAAALLTIWTYSSVGRPIWIDEFLHFALGSHSSAGEAWDTIRATGLTFNFGQTGTYMMIDYWLLKIFGASAVWLRAPSVLSSALLLYGTVKFFQSQGHSFFWPLIAIATLFCQQDLMYYAGEARPYMPLASASVGTLAYYSVPADERHTWPTRALGFASVVWGALMHPYFSIYWLALAVFTHWNALQGYPRFSLSGFVRHCNPHLGVLGTTVYFAIGASTWLRGGPKLDFDPLYWFTSTGLLTPFIYTHFEFTSLNTAVLLTGVFSAATIALMTIPRLKRYVLASLLSPYVLVSMALMLSGIVSFESYRGHYWILGRQWVASIALVTIGTVWFVARLSEITNLVFRHVGTCLALLVTFCIAMRVVSTAKVKSNEALHWLTPAITSHIEDNGSIPATNDEWVALANANIAAGGGVWVIFRKFYNK